MKIIRNYFLIYFFTLMPFHTASSETEFNFTATEYPIAFNLSIYDHLFRSSQIQDINGDSYPDILIGNHLYINNKNLDFNSQLIFLFEKAYLSESISCCIVDYNRDGFLDFAYPSQIGPIVFINQDNHSWIPYQPSEFNNIPCEYILSGDINNDSYTDIVVFCDEVKTWFGDRSGKYTYFPKTSQPSIHPRKAQLIDLNNDSSLDIVALDRSFNFYFYLGLADGSFAVPSSFRVPIDKDPSTSFQCMDYDIDGKLDILSSGLLGWNSFIKYQENNFSIQSKFYAMSPVPVDLDQDGNMDFVAYKLSKNYDTYENNPATISIYLNRKNGTEWQQQDLYQSDDSIFSIHILDLNRDGKQDIFLIESQKAVLLLNRGIIQKPSRTTTAVIHVPDDSLTINDAITKSIDGDTIQIAPGIYRDSILIQNKKITLEAKDPDQKPMLDSCIQYGCSTLSINQSDVTLRDLNISGLQGEGILVDSSNLV